MTTPIHQGPTLPISVEIDEQKYRQKGETFREKCSRIADALADSKEHFHVFRDILLDQRFLPAGRVQAAMGAARQVTPYNCFVSEPIEDSMEGIMRAATRAATTMRLGGGIGYDFSTIRPAGDLITKLDSQASGPVSFMGIFDAVCETIAAAGHRRGAQMGVLRVDHPDIETFIRAKRNSDKLKNFNISVGITDKFMEAVEEDEDFDLVWEGRRYRTIRARHLWDEIMRNTWDWAEPGVLFLDRINGDNNLYFIETITATNPCAEQPLPPNGACLLGSLNLVKYVKDGKIRYDLMSKDLPAIVLAMDNVIDRAIYPLPEQEEEAKNKRRMGLGVTGVANALEACGYSYGSPEFIEELEAVLKLIMNEAYLSSALIASEKGSFPLYDAPGFMHSTTWEKLDEDVKEAIRMFGLRNSHLTSIAPTGTISLTADNVSSGIEPVFSYGYDRTIQTPRGPKVEHIDDYGVRTWGVRGKTADQCSIDDHINVLLASQKWTDSAVSKTLNVGDHVTFEEFKDIYMRAWKGDAKGCTTFRAAGKRMGILNAKPESEENEGVACYFDPDTGRKSCE